MYTFLTKDLIQFLVSSTYFEHDAFIIRSALYGTFFMHFIG